MNKNWVSRIMLFLSAILAVIAIAAWTFPSFHASEKPGALFVFGHWWDIPWQVGLPAAIAALATAVTGAAIGWRSRRSTATA